MTMAKKPKGRLFLLTLLSLALVLAVLLVSAFYGLDRAPTEMPPSTIFRLNPGESASSAGRRLEAEGLIRSADWFSLYSRFSGLSDDLKAGSYETLPGTAASTIVKDFAEGRQATVKITVPEGFTTSQLSRLLETRMVCPAQEFISAAGNKDVLAELGIPAGSAEGYLFPDTYVFPLGTDAASVVETMVGAFRKALSRDIPRSSSMSAEEIHEKVILASIVEREYRIADEAPLMASVFYNRMRIGMALQSCATVVYVLTEHRGQSHPEVLSLQDIAVKDPYNTYLERGLPPGPISNPGLVSLNAVFNPPKTDYLYFRLVEPETGAHHFSRSLGEHNQAANLYTKVIPEGR